MKVLAIGRDVKTSTALEVKAGEPSPGYTRDPDPLPTGQPYFWTAIGPTGTAYLGVTGGIIALRDG